MDACGYALLIHRKLPNEPDKWKPIIESELTKVPQEHREWVRDYLRGMYKRLLVVRAAKGVR